MKNLLDILVAEDNEDDLLLLQQAFRKAGAQSRSHTVRDGLETINYLAGEGAFRDRASYPFPDILLLDLNMPRMNGFEVLRWVREDAQCRRLVVHVLSTSAREDDVELAYELGASSYLIKPSRIDELVALVAALHHWHRFTAFPQKPSPDDVLSQVHETPSHLAIPG